MERPARARRTSARSAGRPASAGVGGPTAAAYAAAICGIALAAAVFLPWYATNLGAPFTTGAASGWEWTGLARIALALAVLAAGASAALVMRDRGSLAMEPEIAVALGWATVGAHAGAFALVAYRVLVLPEPADLLSRELGLYVALLAALAGAIAGAVQLNARD
jgi:hypothetical protein